MPAKEDTIEFAAPTVILFGQDDKGVKHPLSLSTTAIADHDPAEPYSINRVPRVHKYIKGAAEHLIMFGVNTLKDSAMPANSNGHGNYGLAANKYLSARALTHVQQMVLPRPETVPSPIPEVTAWQNNSHTTTIPGTERF